MSSDKVSEAAAGVESPDLGPDAASNGTGEKWGLQLPHLYQLAIKCHKDNEGKVIQQTYERKLEFVALTQQVAHGPCQPENLPPLGVLDVIGRDRRQAWQALGPLGREEAMLRYVDLLDAVCPAFRPYADAHKCQLEAEHERLESAQQTEQQAQLAEEQERRQQEQQERLEELAREQQQLEARRQEETKRHIKEALNKQTNAQFRAYAEQQYPGSPEQQSLLMVQLQEQHYQQYIQQLYQQQQQQGQETAPASAPETAPASPPNQPPAPPHDQTDARPSAKPEMPGPETPAASLEETQGLLEKVSLEETHGLLEGVSAEEMADLLQDTEEGEETESADGDAPEVGAASMWTRQDLAEFKSAIRSEGGDAVLKVGHGETVTIRVPTHEDGTCLFWEFATDSYDLGFGVFFEWGPSEDSEVTIHVSESEDDEDDPENADDPERGAQADREEQPLTSCILPVYRRDCHQEVYAGSHIYPGQGVYQLKFDNSYSLWRSKTLYYRVFYTR